jgi:predicted NUDIX family NTP pyrophosphohydrolase
MYPRLAIDSTDRQPGSRCTTIKYHKIAAAGQDAPKKERAHESGLLLQGPIELLGHRDDSDGRVDSVRVVEHGAGSQQKNNDMSLGEQRHSGCFRRFRMQAEVQRLAAPSSDTANQPAKSRRSPMR